MQIEPIVVAAIGMSSAVVASVLTAALGEWRARSGEARAHQSQRDAEHTARLLEALRQTRLRAFDSVERLKSAATSGVFRKREAGTFDGADDQLIGETDAARAYREILVELQNSLGRGLSAELSRKATRVLVMVATALRAQEERLRRGDDLATVPVDVAAELFDMDAFSDRLLAIDSPPSIGGRLNRAVVDGLRWWQTRRKGGG